MIVVGTIGRSIVIDRHDGSMRTAREEIVHREGSMTTGVVTTDPSTAIDRHDVSTMIVVGTIGRSIVIDRPDGSMRTAREGIVPSTVSDRRDVSMMIESAMIEDSEGISIGTEVPRKVVRSRMDMIDSNLPGNGEETRKRSSEWTMRKKKTDDRLGPPRYLGGPTFLFSR
jgi:hypothetical protein